MTRTVFGVGSPGGHHPFLQPYRPGKIKIGKEAEMFDSMLSQLHIKWRMCSFIGISSSTMKLDRHDNSAVCVSNAAYATSWIMVRIDRCALGAMCSFVSGNQNGDTGNGDTIVDA